VVHARVGRVLGVPAAGAVARAGMHARALSLPVPDPAAGRERLLRHHGDLPAVAHGQHRPARRHRRADAADPGGHRTPRGAMSYLPNSNLASVGLLPSTTMSVVLVP